MANKNEAVFIQIDNERIELTGAELDKFKADKEKLRVQIELREAEYKAKQDARESAIKKLADIAGLTKEELASIL
jgi:SMC interacting uncharacterized protein involved in chromosome segregation